MSSIMELKTYVCEDGTIFKHRHDAEQYQARCDLDYIVDKLGWGGPDQLKLSDFLALNCQTFYSVLGGIAGFTSDQVKLALAKRRAKDERP